MELTPAQVNLWFHYEEIAMHFNELIIQYRLQLMGGTGAIGAVAAYLILAKVEGADRRRLQGLVSLMMLVLLVAAAGLDLFYYNRLLDGAVVALLEFEKNHPEINMSTYIHAEVQRWAKLAIWLWYAAIIVPLSIFVYWSWRTEGQAMNVRRGLIRVWVLISCLWVPVAGGVGYDTIKERDAFSGRYQFVLVVEKGVDILTARWDKPGDFIAPRSIEGGPQFSAVQHRYYQSWAKSELDGTRVRHVLPDGTWLYLPSFISKDDQDYLKKQFWSQRWGRWFEAIWPWVLLAFGVPIAVFVLGRAIQWAVSGFRA